MQTVTLYKYIKTGDKIAPNLRIEFTQEIPDFPRNIPTNEAMRQSEEQFTQQAQALADGLESVLPGGTLDRLIGLLLLRKASHFIVGWTVEGMRVSYERVHTKE